MKSGFFLLTTSWIFASRASAFVLSPLGVLSFSLSTCPKTNILSRYGSYEPQRQQQPSPEDEPSLLLGNADEMEAQMQQFRSKYPTSEADYLAAARARAKAKSASREIAATQSDFEKVAEEKKQQGLLNMDDWEASAQEAGNMDSQILLPQLPDDDDDAEGAEPMLLL